MHAAQLQACILELRTCALVAYKGLLAPGNCCSKPLTTDNYCYDYNHYPFVLITVLSILYQLLSSFPLSLYDHI